MSRPSRAAVVATGVLLATCGAAPAATTDSHAGHEPGTSGAPGTPHPSVPEDADGSIELVHDLVAGGGGVSIATALESASGFPALIVAEPSASCTSVSIGLR